ncbi:MAG: hypothetical protein QOJ39_2414 [Candidatus Eremiobacteraeota bacterium]|jgi:hypothetical protein|nr:hypothetical protein [Candidatus Eremiobacteraeota bacterium]
MDGYIIPSIHNELDLDFVYSGQEHAMQIKVRNELTTSVRLVRDDDPRIRIGFKDAGTVSFDPSGVSCPGFRVASYENDVLEFALELSELWWLEGDMLVVSFAQFRADGPPGLGTISAEITGLSPALGAPMMFPLVRLNAPPGPPRTLATSWLNGNVVPVAAAFGAPTRESSLAFMVMPHSVDPSASGGAMMDSKHPIGDARIVVTLASGNSQVYRALTAPGLAQSISATSRGWTSTPLSGAAMPTWELRPDQNEVGWKTDGNKREIPIGLAGIVSNQARGTGHVIVYTMNFPGLADGHAVLGVKLATAPVSIDSFTATPATVANLTGPATVNLSWATTNATAVTISQVGAVDTGGTNWPVQIEQTTTFVLIAFDAALSTIVSKVATVQVTPSVTSRLVPQGAIAIWKDTVASIPPNWQLCDGSNGSPDLRDRFVMGAGTTPPKTAGPADTHTHQIAALSGTFSTNQAGAHTHGVPSAWYGRGLSCGKWSGIDAGSNPNAQTQSAGTHGHTVAVSFNGFTSDANTGGVRPPWYALCYIMKT